MNKLYNVYIFYKEGFSNLTVGKTLWKIVLIKLIIIIGFLNFYIYDKSIDTEYKTTDKKIDYILKNLIQEK